MVKESGTYQSHGNKHPNTQLTASPKARPPRAFLLERWLVLTESRGIHWNQRQRTNRRTAYQTTFPASRPTFSTWLSRHFHSEIYGTRATYSPVVSSSFNLHGRCANHAAKSYDYVANQHIMPSCPIRK